MILWLEDRETTALSYISELDRSGFDSHMVGTIQEFATFLDEDIEINGLVFIIDIMLPGVNDLNAINVSNAPTGSGNRAGQVLVDRFLRSRDSRYQARPVLFLTERTIEPELREEIEALTRDGTGPVAILQKYVDEDLMAFIPTLRQFLDYAPEPEAQVKGEIQTDG